MDDPERNIRVLVTLRVSALYREELSQRIGDPEPPYYDVLNAGDAENRRRWPSARDRLVFEKFSERESMISESHSRSITEPPAGFEAYPEAKAVAGIKAIHMSGVEIPTWFQSPYPAEYARRECMSVCDLCLNYLPTDLVARRHHHRHCKSRDHQVPPGTEIYRDGTLSIFEVDGALAPLYCQNLCLLAKLFLYAKTLYQDVQPFLFYVLVESDAEGAHFRGYFSKQKSHASRHPAPSGSGNGAIEPIQNVSCIMALPSRQNKGVGQFLIDFSYLLTRVQKTTGSPERPLSSLGLRAYTSYWSRCLCYAVRDLTTPSVSIKTLSSHTGMTEDDVILGLEILGWLNPRRSDRLVVDVDDMERRISAWEAHSPLALKPEKLLWVAPPEW